MNIFNNLCPECNKLLDNCICLDEVSSIKPIGRFDENEMLQLKDAIEVITYGFCVVETDAEIVGLNAALFHAQHSSNMYDLSPEEQIDCIMNEMCTKNQIHSDFGLRVKEILTFLFA